MQLHRLRVDESAPAASNVKLDASGKLNTSLSNTLLAKARFQQKGPHDVLLRGKEHVSRAHHTFATYISRRCANFSKCFGYRRLANGIC